LTLKLHPLYAALKKHGNPYYNNVSSFVMRLSLRELGIYLGITSENLNEHIEGLNAIFSGKSVDGVNGISARSSAASDLRGGGYATGLGVIESLRDSGILGGLLGGGLNAISKILDSKKNHQPQNEPEWFDSIPQFKQEEFLEKMMELAKIQANEEPQRESE
jgi:hypothetical protein